MQQNMASELYTQRTKRWTHLLLFTVTDRPVKYCTAASTEALEALKERLVKLYWLEPKMRQVAAAGMVPVDPRTTADVTTDMPVRSVVPIRLTDARTTVDVREDWET